MEFQVSLPKLWEAATCRTTEIKEGATNASVGGNGSLDRYIRERNIAQTFAHDPPALSCAWANVPAATLVEKSATRNYCWLARGRIVGKSLKWVGGRIILCLRSRQLFESVLSQASSSD
jgi:hypothetical protein